MNVKSDSRLFSATAIVKSLLAFLFLSFVGIHDGLRAVSKDSLRYPVQKLVDRHPIKVNINKAWEKKAEQKLLPRPLVNGGSVFAAFQPGIIEAYGAADGHLIWRKEMPGMNGLIAALESSILVKDHEKLIALSEKNGDLLWEVDVGSDFLYSTVKTDGGVSMVALLKGNILFGLNMTDGSMKKVSELRMGLERPTAFSFDGKRNVALVFENRTVSIFSIKRGKKLWSFRGGSRVLAAPLIWPRRIVVMCEDNFFYCLTLKKGHQVFRKKSENRLLNDGVKLRGLLLFSPFASRNLSSFNISTGTIQPLFSLEQERHYFITAPSFSEGYLACSYSDFFSGSDFIINFSVIIEEVPRERTSSKP
ncbi:MAG: PQQ-binding-like beta-propeller repeat protein [Acidobacteriota bacterium]